VEDIFVTLAEPSRREIVEILKRRPRRAGELSDLLDMSPQAMSRHLRMLRKTGLVQERIDETDARARVYSLRPERFVELQEWLEEIARFWTEQLHAFKEHAEKKKKKR
jgi:DNA-binding transcriptional ArsR family regulator